MATARRLSELELGLEYFYSRTYRAQYVLRIGTIGLVATACMHFGLLSGWTALAWFIAFLLCEAGIWLWWRRVEPELGSMDVAAAKRRQQQMIVCCAASTAAASAPFVFSSPSSIPAGVVSVLFVAGVIMLIAAQQSMTRNMFLITAPIPAFALVRNMMHLGGPEYAYVMAGLALCFVVNARQLQLSNARGEAGLVRSQVEAQRANDAKRDFLATVSHEIRTPLNGVLGMAQAMAHHPLSADQAERLAVVRRSGAALQTLLNDVLDLSKIEAGKLELEIQPFNLARAVAAAVDPFLALAGGKGLEIRLQLESLDGMVLGDPNRLRQVIANLVSNAVKFTEHGSVSIRGRRLNGQVLLEVEDTGIGLSSALQAGLFGRFVQADASTAHRYGGTGLGLAICRDLTRLMGGEIAVTSAPGAGACFRVTLPLPAISAAEKAAEERAPPPRRADDGAALRILVAEDNPTNRLVLQHLLPAIGAADVTFVDNGQDAVTAHAEAAWDLILMDINMPVLDGVAATAEIRRRESVAGLPPTPIIALTANAMSHQELVYRETGMDAVIAKPLTAEALLNGIAQVLDGSGPADTPHTSPEAPEPLRA